MTQKQELIAVAMSGGVDSSVAAHLLKQAGHNVVGLFMKNWEDQESACTVQDDADDVAKVCNTLQIPYYSFNFSSEYRDQVFADFLEQLKKGRTPNPDILCNKEIKFKVLLENAKKLGATKLATGHYAQNIYEQGQWHLKRGCDEGKDQSYFLYTLNQDILSHVLFPIGHLEKRMVRQIARDAHLATAEKKDSTGICFIGKRNFTCFLQQYIAFQPGSFQTLSGKTVGTHHGVAYYTIGQRKGLGIGGPGDAWFVVKKDVQDNIVYVEQGDQHPALYSYSLTAIEPTWVSGITPHYPFTCSAKIRYRQTSKMCTIDITDDGSLSVLFEEPQRAITPQQSIVFYDDALCLGGALIEQAGPSL